MGTATSQHQVIETVSVQIGNAVERDLRLTRSDDDPAAIEGTEIAYAGGEDDEPELAPA